MRGEYAAAFSIYAGKTDVKINFFDVDPVVESGEIAGEDRELVTKVILSLPVAKQLANHLSAAVKQYEEYFGEVLDLDIEK